NQIDVVVDHDPAGALGREAQAVGPPVVQLIPPEDLGQVVADLIVAAPIGARHAVVAVAGGEIEAHAEAGVAPEAAVVAPPVGAVTTVPIGAPAVAVETLAELAPIAVAVTVPLAAGAVRTVHAAVVRTTGT